VLAGIPDSIRLPASSPDTLRGPKMPDSHLSQKLKLKAGSRAAILNAPARYLPMLEPLPGGVELSLELDGKFDWIQLFVKSRSDLDDNIGKVARSLNPQSLLWVCFPKSSSRLQSDLTREKGWEELRKMDLKWITLVSVDDIWSAFALRPYRNGESRTTS
jgi:hypothetical protein